MVPRKKTKDVSGVLCPRTIDTMTPEDRDQMIELCRRIARETDAKRLAAWIEDLKGLIQNKIRELRDAQKPMTE